MSTPTLTALLESAGTAPRLYHMGRRVAPCSIEQFRAFEEQRIAWPQPWQSNARIALVMTPAPGREPVIWCLSLPLDEHAMLIPAQRDGFIEQLLMAQAHDEKGHLDLEGAADGLKNVAIAFQPDQTALSLLHARLSRDLDRPPSRYYDQAQAFLTSADSRIDWAALGLQGVADFAIRRTPVEEKALAEALPGLADEALMALGECLQHAPPETDVLIEALIARHRTAIHPALAQAMLGAALASDRDIAADWLDRLLAEGPRDAVFYAVVAARGWHHLENEQRPEAYLNGLAHLEVQDFQTLVRDLTRIPRLRLPLIMALQKAPDDSVLAYQIAAIKREAHE